MTRPLYEQALADAGVGLEELERLHDDHTRYPSGEYRKWRLDNAARNALPILIAGLRSETARADKAAAEAEALRVERDEAVKRHLDYAATYGETIDKMLTRAQRAEAALAEAQRQAAEATRAGWIKCAQEADQFAIDNAGAHDNATSEKQRGIFEARTGACQSLAARFRALALPSAPGSAETEGANK